MSTPLASIVNTASKVYRYVLNVPYPKTEDEKLKYYIRTAQSDWQRAETLFQEATSPELVDHAIYEVMAAKIKYNYLLKEAKEKNFNGSPR